MEPLAALKGEQRDFVISDFVLNYQGKFSINRANIRYLSWFLLSDCPRGSGGANR
jgi:hypothetical protein